MNSLSVTFGGQTMQLDASGALYWPAQKLLAVSDMHLEKSTFLAHHGSLIPPYDTRDTLDRLDAMVALYTPRELLLLGDSFHDRYAWERLDETARGRIASLKERVEQCSWLEGNHDVALASNPLPTMLAQREIDGILFRHEHGVTSLPQIIGHYHPTVTLSIRGRRLRDKCFVHNETLLVMPSFGSYTGGLSITDPAFLAVIPHPTDVHFIYRQTIRTLRGLAYF